MIRLTLILMLALLLPLTEALTQQAEAPSPPTAREIIDRVDVLMRGDTNCSTYEMTVVTPDWSRTVRMRSWENRAGKTSFIRITYPAKDKGTGFLKIKYNLWMYLPSVERTIRVPPSMMLQSWMGSDFTNDDLVRESSIVEDYDHALLSVEDVGDSEAYKVELTPKPEAPVVWDKIVFWVRAGDFVPLREQFFDEDGELIKELRFSEIKLMDDRVIPTHWEMRSLTKEGHVTRLSVSQIDFDCELPRDVFTRKNLKRIDR